MFRDELFFIHLYQQLSIFLQFWYCPVEGQAIA